MERKYYAKFVLNNNNKIIIGYFKLQHDSEIVIIYN